MAGRIRQRQDCGANTWELRIFLGKSEAGKIRPLKLGSTTLKRETLQFQPTEICLCHSDGHTGNFLRDASDRWWVIDWEATRFPVAAHDFNHSNVDRLSQATDEWMMRKYCRQTERDLKQFSHQVRFCWFLGAIRSFNFLVLVLDEGPRAYGHQLEQARVLAPAYQ